MNELEGKKVRICLNSMSGIITEVGMCIGVDSDFIIINNYFNKKIQYISKYYIKYIEIINDYNEEKYE